MFRLRRRGTVEVKSQATFDRLDAEFEPERRAARRPARSASSSRDGPARRGTPVRRRRSSIDTRDCIGCDVCVAHCDKGVLRMVDGKAMVDLRNLNQCDMDGECVEVCPTNVVELLIQPMDPPTPLTPEEEREFGQPLPPRGRRQPPAAA